MIVNPEIIDAFVHGDHEAFRKIFYLAYPKVRAFIRGFIKDVDDVEEVTQLIFIRLWNKRMAFSQVRCFDAYLFTLAKYTLFNYMATENAMAKLEESDTEKACNEQTPHDELVAKDLQLLIDMVVDGMPPQRKLIYRLSRVKGLSNDEIAQTLNLQKKTVENHLNLALREIRQALSLYVLCFLMISGWGQ